MNERISSSMILLAAVVVIGFSLAGANHTSPQPLRPVDTAPTPMPVAADPPEPEPLTLSDVHFKYNDDEKLVYVAHVQNNSNARVQGSICMAVYDKDGFEVDSLASASINLGVADGGQFNGWDYVKVRDFNEVRSIKVYVSKYGCDDTRSEALSNIIGGPINVQSVAAD